VADGMFGTPTGFRTYDRDQAELGLIAGQAQHQRSLSELNQAQADTLRRKQASDEQLLAIIAGNGKVSGPGGQPVEPEAVLNQLSNAASVYASLGRFDEAGRLVKDIAQATENFAQGRSAQAAEAAAELRASIARRRMLEQRLASINGPQRYAEVMMQLRNDPVIAGQIPDWLGKGYNQPAISAFVAGSPAEIAKLELGLKQAAGERDERRTKNLVELREVSGSVKKRLAAVSEGRLEHLQKAGAGRDAGIAVPREEDQTAALQALKKAGFGGAATEAALEIAERALILRRNRAVGPTEALERVIAEAKAGGELVEEPFGNKFVSRPGSMSRPLPLPATPAAAKRDNYYRLPNGALVKNVGPDDFEMVGQPMKTPQVLPRDPAEQALLDEED
jgi:hypothetical protein